MSGKKVLTLFIFILFVYAWYLLFYARQNPPTVKLTSVQSQLTLFVQPDAGHNFLIEEIKKAQKQILVEVYLLSDKEVISALENEDKSGVDVKVILEEHPFGGGGLNPKTKKDLEANGIEVVWSNPNFALTHEKMVLIDDEEVFILNQNLTISSFTKNREYDILDKNLKDVQEIKNIFNADWSRQSFYPSITNIIESPNTARPALTTLIESSSQNINIEAEVINDTQITNLLIDKNKTSKVKLIIPTLKQLAGNKKDVDKLLQGGVEVHTLSSPYIHAKLILVDNKLAYIGSINFSSQSMDENRELGVILSDKNIINTLENYFQLDWDKSTPLTSNSN